MRFSKRILDKKNVKLKFYHINKNFNPTDLKPTDNEAVLLVNYYGVMSTNRMKSLAKPYKNVIIDNSQAFFNVPIDNCMNIYSCRKFVGVPDGAYVIGKGAESYVNEYEQCYSSDTSLFMLQRIEYGCEGKAYQSRQINEHRIDTEDCMKMSKLTRTILDGTDYAYIKDKRIQNFAIAQELLGGLNRINASEYYDAKTVPMVYPLLIEDDGLLEKLQTAKHFQGHWWSYICKEMPENCVEHWISRFMIPITIDQRYGKNEIHSLCEIIKG